MNQKSPLPKKFDSLAYVSSMQAYTGLKLDDTTQREVGKLIDVAFAMASVVYEAPLDDNHFDLANIYSAGQIHE